MHCARPSSRCFTRTAFSKSRFIGRRASSTAAPQPLRAKRQCPRACDPMLIEAHALQTLAVDHHVVAAVSITGAFIEVVGSLFLAYDLLGGQHGPLRLITRAVTYSLVFSAGYAIGLGPLMGLSAGLTTGFTVAIELHRRARRGDHYSLFWETVFTAIRGAGFGLGVYRMGGFRFALAFAIVSTLGQVVAYSRE